MSVFATVQAPNEAWLSKAIPEDVLEPGLPIVDAHLHLWDFAGFRYFVPEHARDIAVSGHNVVASIYVECFMNYRTNGPEHLRYVGETEHAMAQAAIADSADYTSSRIAAAVVAYADLNQGEKTREALEAHIAAGRGRVRGIRQRAKWDADPVVRGHYCAQKPHLYLDPEFGQGIDVLTSLGLAFDASVYHPQIGEVAELAARHPETTIVLNHSGSPVGHSSYAGKDEENYAVWLAGMKALSKCPNAHIKLGGVLMNLANFDFTSAQRPPTSAELAQLWRPWIEPCIELFGAERCLVSSNFPVDRVGFSYRTVWNMFKLIAEQCTADEKSMLFADTARKVYRLGDVDSGT